MRTQRAPGSEGATSTVTRATPDCATAEYDLTPGSKLLSSVTPAMPNLPREASAGTVWAPSSASAAMMRNSAFWPGAQRSLGESHIQ